MNEQDFCYYYCANKTDICRDIYMLIPYHMADKTINVCHSFKMKTCMHPEKSTIELFLDVFERLSVFEAEQRMIRHYGTFTEAEIEKTNKEIKPVLDWLKSLT